MSDVKSARPLSPHLSIYKFRPTMAMSIMHRITGGALYVGTLFFVWWLVAAASGEDAYNAFSGFFGSIIGEIILFGYSWALLHHAFGGIRHLTWDTGHGLQKETSTRLAQMTLVGSLVATLVLWLIIVIFT